MNETPSLASTIVIIATVLYDNLMIQPEFPCNAQNPHRVAHYLSATSFNVSLTFSYLIAKIQMVQLQVDNSSEVLMPQGFCI